MRLPTALLCLGLALPLAGCFQAGATGDATPGMTAAAPAPAPAPDAEPPAPAMPAGRGATAPKPPKRSAAADKDKTEKEEWWKEGGVTREKINGMCWMKYESGRKDLPVEKRADLVNQCVIDTLKEYPVN